ncbi:MULTISPECIES: U32 family peptidase [unclassified Paenibacillus]|uniref:U32 family peptidase n=1 Tax=unclassified Paenibacillus TaxID=185978 RepID=UPI0030F5852F
MRFFSIPADFKETTINGYVELAKQYPGSQVLETYGQISINNSFESGRINEYLPQIDMYDLTEYIRYCEAKGIGFNYVFNAPYMHNREFTAEGVKETKQFISALYKAGVRSLTVTLPSLMDLVNSMELDIKIKASVICQINSVNKALHYKKNGVDRIVLDESINRDFDMLRRIASAFGDKSEIIINSLCHQECTYRMFHYNQTSGVVRDPMDTGTNYYTTRCALKIFQDVNQLMKLSWIRPEDLHYYESIGIRYYKLQGREYVNRGNPLKAVEAYFRGSFDGNLMELLDMFSSNYAYKFSVDNKLLDGFLKPFYDIQGYCKKDCTRCSYCDRYASKSVVSDGVNEISALAKDFHTKYDDYKKFVRAVDHDKKEEASSTVGGIEIEFDF